MELARLSLPQNHQLLQDYQQYSPSSPIHSFFHYHPWHEDQYADRYQFLQRKRKQAPRKKLVQALRSFASHNHFVHDQVRRNLSRLEQENSCVVIGGQQAGLLTGPLYTLYKAMTIIQLADREERRLGVPVIPIFWIAGEDHDYEEVNHIWIRNHQEELHKQVFTGAIQGQGQRSISLLEYDPTMMKKWLKHVIQSLPDSRYKSDWVRVSQEVIESTTSWTQAFALFMNKLFGQWGLILVDSADPEIRLLEREFFVELIENNDQIAEQLMKTNQQLTQYHYKHSIHIEADHAHLFIEQDCQRLPLFRRQNLWTTRDGVHRFTKKELLEIARKTPEKLSNNVITRPLMQEYLFPILATVGGPSEIAYWSLLKNVFTCMDLQMPIVYPRLQLTLVDPTVWKRKESFGFTWEDLFVRFDQKKIEWLRSQASIPMEPLFEQAKGEIDQIYHRLIQTLEKQFGRHLKEIGQKNHQKVLDQLTFLHKYADQMVSNKYQDELRQLNEIHQRLFPLEKPQERVYNVMQVWNQHGIDWLQSTMSIPLLSKIYTHYIVRM